MDSITQAVLGASIGAAGFRERLGRRALWVGAACGTLPDLDVVMRAAGAWESLVWHRGPSHSLLVLPLVAVALGPVCQRFAAWRDPGGPGAAKEDRWAWAHLCFWALITHPLLDAFTSYGTQLFAPVSDARFALDGVSIIDPLYTVPLVLALWAGRASSRWTHRGPRLSQVALAWSTLYLGLGLVQHERAETVATDALAEAKVDVEHLRVMPTLANNVAYRIAAKDPTGAIHVGYVSTLAPRPVSLVTARPLDDPLVATLSATERGRIMGWFADDLLSWSVERDDDGHRVYTLSDQRYGSVRDPLAPFWGARAVVDDTGSVLAFDRFQNQRSLDMKAELSALWTLIVDGRAPEQTP